MKYNDLNWSEETAREHCLIEADNNEACWICNEPTRYIEYCAEVRICSDRCMEELGRRLS